FNGADVNSKKPSWVIWKSVLAAKDGCGDIAFKNLVPRLYALESMKNIEVASKLSHGGLEFSFRHNPRGGVEQTQFERKLIDNVILPNGISKTRWIKECNLKIFGQEDPSMVNVYDEVVYRSFYWIRFRYFIVNMFYPIKDFVNPMETGSMEVATHWADAAATWYGSPDGFGSDGGSCGYGTAVSQAPFSSMVTGIGPSLYNNGKECGACYDVKCTKHPSCSRKPARVVITDFCPGGPCASDHAHFDLSGTAFGAMAKPGQEKHLRDAGVLQIRFARVSCDFSRTKIVFRVDQGSNPNYFATLVEFEEGDGDLAGVSLKEESSDEWLEMVQSWGAVWKIDPGRELHPPFSLRLISKYSQQVLVAKNVIPTGWTPGATYRSIVNYL
nr:expansin-B15-like [Tanacetum cinerariifolium]